MKDLADVASALERAEGFLAGQQSKTAQYRRGRAGQLLGEVDQALTLCRGLMLNLHEVKRALKRVIEETNNNVPLSPAMP
ncbi:MAG: hypothetical protein Q8P75_02605 [bacterium]|nr:hypothetical protein [bacterium]